MWAVDHIMVFFRACSQYQKVGHNYTLLVQSKSFDGSFFFTSLTKIAWLYFPHHRAQPHRLISPICSLPFEKCTSSVLNVKYPAFKHPQNKRGVIGQCPIIHCCLFPYFRDIVFYLFICTMPLPVQYIPQNLISYFLFQHR